MIKLIATDLDGTLLNPGGLTVSERNIEALKKASEKGVKIVICTGRMFAGGQKFAQLIPGDQPVVAVNGAVVRMSRSLEYLRRIGMKPDALLEVMKYLREENVSPWFYSGDLCLAEEPSDRLEELVNRTNIEARIVSPLEDYVDQKPEKILAVTDPAKVDELQKRLGKIFTGKLYVTRSSPKQLEILDPQATKGTALAMVAEHFGIKKEEVIAFGDNFNDIELFKGAGVRVAMGNGEAALKEHADIIAPTNVEAGVGKIIERLVLGE